MISRNITSLLRRKRLSGREVGRALLATLAYDMERKGKPHKPLFTSDDIQSMESKLTSRASIEEYAVYRSIYLSIIDHHNKGQAMEQQFFNGYYRALMTLHAARASENWENRITNFPCIMTPKQYKREAAAVVQFLKSRKDSLYSVFFTVLDSFLEKKENAPENFRAAVEETKKEPATNPRILDNYRLDHLDYARILPNGTVSNRVSSKKWIKEWTEALKSSLEERENINPDEMMESFFNGAEAIRELCERLSPGALPPCADEELEEAFWYAIAPWNRWMMDPKENGGLYGHFHAIPKGWHLMGVILNIFRPLPTLPTIATPSAKGDGLTKYDILFSRSAARYKGGVPQRVQREAPDSDMCALIAEEPIEDQFLEFLDDYPKISTVLLEYISAKVPAAKEAAENKDFFTAIFECGELEKVGMPGYEEYTKPTDEGFSSYYEITGEWRRSRRAKKSGIAVLCKGSGRRVISPGGDFLEFNTSADVARESVLHIANDPEEMENMRFYIDGLALYSISYLMAYNAFIGILADTYNVPELNAVKIDLSYHLEKIDELNKEIYSFYFNASGDKTATRDKRAAIKKAFRPIDPQACEPSAQNLDAMREEIESLGSGTAAARALNRFDPYIKRLITEVKLYE